MKTIAVNTTEFVEGELLVSNRIDVDQNGTEKIVTEGTFISETYFEEIEVLESDRLKVLGIFVLSETFSSETNNIIYQFVAEKLERR